MARSEERCQVGLSRVEADTLAVEGQQQCLRIPADLCICSLGLRYRLVVLCANNSHAHVGSEVFEYGYGIAVG